MDIVLEHVQISKLPWKFFASICSSRDHDVMGETFLLIKPIKFDVNGKRILCWSVFAIEPIPDFCLFSGYWSSKNSSRDRGRKGEFISLAIAIVLCTTGKTTLYWSIFAIESMADFYPFWGFWPLKNGSRDQGEKDEFVSLAKPFALVPLDLYHWKESFMLINNCNRTHNWFHSVSGLLTFKIWATWPWCKWWICFSRRTYRIWYRYKKTFCVG